MFRLLLRRILLVGLRLLVVRAGVGEKGWVGGVIVILLDVWLFLAGSWLIVFVSGLVTGNFFVGGRRCVALEGGS